VSSAEAALGNGTYAKCLDEGAMLSLLAKPSPP
jgi:hypothetical protein